MALVDDIRHMIEHDTAAAQALLGKLTHGLPGSADAWTLLGVSYLRRLDFQRAAAAFSEALKVDPKHNEALHQLPFCLMEMGDNLGALTAYRQAFSITASTASLRATALLSHRLGQLEFSIRCYEMLLKKCTPTSTDIPPALHGLAAVLRDAGRPLAADRQTQRLLDLFEREGSQPFEGPRVASQISIRSTGEDLPEWSRYVDKAHLGRILMRRRAADPSVRVPETFILPEDREALARFAASGEARLFIVKPARESGGQGITVVDDVSEVLDRGNVVVQRYVDRPLLVDGLKSHCRIYGLIASSDPLRAYIYSDGLVRFAPEPYDPRPGAPGGIAMHITNTALHEHHPGMKLSQDPAEEDVGLVWSLQALLRRITADGGDGEAVFAEIKAVTEWVVRMLAAEGLFARTAAAGPRRSFSHKLFGLDMVIDADGHPWLIEMQRVPGRTGTPLVNRINGTMLATIFAMSHPVTIDDGIAPEEAVRILSDPAALLAREAELEMASRGGFVPLDL